MSTLRTTFLLLLFPLSIGVAAQDMGADSSAVRAYPMPKPASIRIESPSVRADYGHNSMDCSTFALTDRNVRFFLRHAKPVSHDTYFHLLTWAECRGEGEIRFANGDLAEFQIEAWGRGNLSLKSGKHAGDVLYYSCEACDGFGVRRTKPAAATGHNKAR
jgi:hypothetical protein